MSADAIAEQAAKHHDVKVLYCKTEADMEKLVQEHVLDANETLVGLSVHSKWIRLNDPHEADRVKKVLVVQVSTEKVTLVLHLGLMGKVTQWAPSANGAFGELMSQADIKKVGLYVLPIVQLLKAESNLECKGVYDIIPMATRVKATSLKKGKTEHTFPELSSPQTLNKDIWALADMALGTTGFKTPSDVHSARWEREITPSVIAWLSYEPIVAKKVYTFLATLEEELETAKGPTPLYVTNLPCDVDVAELKEFFKTTCPQPAHIHTAKKNRSTANAAIYYMEESEAQEAMEKYRGTQFRGREVLISETEEGLKQVEQDMQRDRIDFQVYVSNLPYFTTEAQLKRHFRHLSADIREAKFYCHQDLGVGSVYFTTKESANAAVERFDGSPFLFSVARYNPETGESEVTSKVRSVLLDFDFQTVIKRQKKEDRNKCKGDAEYDALDPYYSHQQRIKGSKNYKFETEDADEVLAASRVDGAIDAPQKPKMVMADKPKMRVVSGEERATEKVCPEMCTFTHVTRAHKHSCPTTRKRTPSVGLRV